MDLRILPKEIVMKILLYLENPEAKILKKYWKIPYLKEIHYKRNRYEEEVRKWRNIHICEWYDFTTYCFEGSYWLNDCVCFDRRYRT